MHIGFILCFNTLLTVLKISNSKDLTSADCKQIFIVEFKSDK